MNKKSILIPVMVLVITLFTGCKEDSPVTVSKFRDILGFGGDNNEEIVALFRVCSWHRWHSNIVDSPEGFGPPYVLSNNYCWAYISDGNGRFVDPVSITCNGNSMQKLEIGQYEYRSNIGHLTNIDWYVENILGHTYQISDQNLPKIDFLNINNDDTLDISNGLHINYSGYLGGDSEILLTIKYHYYVGFSNELHSYRFDKFFPNNGNIILTLADLESFPLSTIDASYLATGYIELRQNKYEEEEFNGKFIGKIYETSMLTWITFERER